MLESRNVSLGFEALFSTVKQRHNHANSHSAATSRWVNTLKTSLLADQAGPTSVMLYLVGLGLADETDITVKGLEVVKKADRVYLEAYTSILLVDKEKLVRSYHVHPTRALTLTEVSRSPSMAEMSSLPIEKWLSRPATRFSLVLTS